MQPPRAVVAFVHLPRTAGTAIREAVLRRAFPPDEVYFVEENPLNLPLAAGGFGGPLSALAELPKAVRDRVRLLVGHMPLDLGLSFDGRTVQYLTFLRDPVERAISTYFYCRSEEVNAAHSYARSLSAAEFVEQGYGAAQNGMTRFLSGATWGLRFGTADQMLAAAEEVLSRCSFIGLYESLGNDVSALQSLRGCRMPRCRASTSVRAIDRLGTASEIASKRPTNWIWCCTGGLWHYGRRAVEREHGATSGRRKEALTPFLTSGEKPPYGCGI
jgi:hypothetical protein